MSALPVVAWCRLSPAGTISYFDGKPMVMPGPVGNYQHEDPLTPHAAAQARIAALEAECEALRKDAERYRGLRQMPYWDGHAWWSFDAHISSPDTSALSSGDEVPRPTDAEYDAAIDEAIEALKETTS